jgi:hypothetical protein
MYLQNAPGIAKTHDGDPLWPGAVVGAGEKCPDQLMTEGEVL